MRLWIDEQPLIDDWVEHVLSDRTAAPVSLSAGLPVPIKLDYFESARLASVELGWSRPGLPDEPVPAEELAPPGGEPYGLRATYFSDQNLQTPVLERVDLDLEFEWGLGSPAPIAPCPIVFPRAGPAPSSLVFRRRTPFT